MIKHRKVFSVDVNNLTKADIEYFRQKLANALIYDPTTAADKARKQLELIEDAAVIYKTTRKERKDD
jgi:hypothetical protein